MLKQELGKIGETISIDYLIKQSYSILFTNWRFKYLEVDIIAQKNNAIYFIEVKTRQQYEMPRDVLTQTKIRNLLNAAEYFIEKYNIQQEVFFDLILIIGNANKYNIKHITNAFNALDY